MKKRIRRVPIIILSIFLLISLCVGIVSSIVAPVYAVEKVQYPHNYEAYGLTYDLNTSRGKKDMLVLSRLETIDNKIDELLHRPIASITNNTTIIKNEVIQNTLVGININGESSSKSKNDKEEEAVKQATKVLNGINKELPGLIHSLKDGSFYEDYIENGDKAISLLSTVAGMLGEKGEAAAAVIDLSQTIYQAIMGGMPATSETAKMEDRLTQQLQDIKNDLSNIEDSIKQLSNELSQSTQKIIDAMPVALERQNDKNRLEKFWKSYDGNFSYDDFYNYINGSIRGNSKASSAYYALLQSALRNGGSKELIKRRYDDLYYVIDKEIKMFEDQIISDNNIKSIVKTYYDYVSSNEEWLLENQDGKTPDMAAIEFAHELYQTMQTADTILAFCHTYHYMQALLSQGDEMNPEYFDYMGRFTISFSQEELDSYYEAITTREKNVQKQFANDIAEILIASNYIVEDQGNYYECSTGSVVKGQKIYLYQIPESICEWFDLDNLNYKYKTVQESNIKQLDHFNYFEMLNDSKTVYLQYDGETVLTLNFTKEDSKFTGGLGTQSDPYLISTKEQFLKIGEGLDKHYQLTRDINFENETIPSIGLTKNSNGGDVVTAFQGSLEGNGFSLRNLKIGQKFDSFAGLFAKIGATGIVENLNFENISVEAEYSNIEQDNSKFYAGIVTGYNLGIIRNCIFPVLHEEGEELKTNSVLYRVTNEEINRSFSVYVGGVAGINAGTISACQLIGVDVKGIAEHSFGGESVNSNQVFVYAGGIAGYNSGKIGFSYSIKQEERGKVAANATITLSPSSNVSPYITALSGGICGKVDEDVLKSIPLENIMECLYSNVSTVGEANIEYKESNYTKGYKNRKENYNFEREMETLEDEDLPDKIPNWMQWLNPWLAIGNNIAEDIEKNAAIAKLNEQKDKDTFEGACYIPIHYGNYADSITINKLNLIKAENENSVLEQISATQRKEYVVEEISGLPEGKMSADTKEFSFKNLVADVKKVGETIDVKSVSVLKIYGFEPLNKSKISAKSMDVVFLLDIELENEDHILHREASTITLDINKLESIDFDFSFGTLSWMQTDTGIESLPNTALTLQSLYGMSNANVVYHYTATTETVMYEYSKLKDSSITVNRLKTDEEGKLVVDEEGSLVVDETFTPWQSSNESLYTAELGHYLATIACTYDGQEGEFFLEYEVYCPHLVWEVETLDGLNHRDATCKELGYDEYTCKLCGKSIYRNIQSVTNEHDFKINEVPATCFSEGKTGSGKCSVCGLEIGEEEIIPRLAHDYSVIVYLANDDTPIYFKNGEYYSDEACTTILKNPLIKKEDDRLISDSHLCTHREFTINENGEKSYTKYHTEQHQYQVSASINDEGGINYTYSCGCGYQYSVDANEKAEDYYELPVIAVSQGYALHAGDEVVVYVQLLNNPGIFGANFGIRYDEHLILKGFEDGNVLKKSLISDSKAVSCGYNYVWANSEELGEKGKDGNLLKLIFAVTEDAKVGDKYPIQVVYDFENGVMGGLAVAVNNSRTTKTQLALTEDGAITIVNQLPGDVNLDGVVDIFDAIEISKYSVGKVTFENEKERDIYFRRADVDLNGTVNLSDIVTILQSLTGGHGVNLLPQEFSIKLDYNGVDPSTLLNKVPSSIKVSLYGDNNHYDLPTPQREGYHFDGWYTRIVDLGADEKGNNDCKVVNDGDHVEYDASQYVQTLYAHWTKNSVKFNGNGETSGAMEDWYYGQDIPTVNYEQKYEFKFTDDVTILVDNEEKNSDEDKPYESKLIGWRTKEEGEIEYQNLEDLKEALESPNFGGKVTLYAVWEAPSIDLPNWTHKGYGNVIWKCGKNKIQEPTFNNSIQYAENGQVTLTATFEPQIYTIGFDLNKGSGSIQPIEECNLTKTNTFVNLNEGSRTGYELLGWSFSEKATTAKYPINEKPSVRDIISDALNNQELTINENKIILYATWKAKSYTIKYHVNSPENALNFVYNEKTYQCDTYRPDVNIDEEKDKDAQFKNQKNISIDSGQTVLGEIYKITGWTFKGWAIKPTEKNVYSQGDLLDDVAIIKDNFAETRDLYAVWELDPWTVGQNVSNGSVVSSLDGIYSYKVYNTEFPKLTQGYGCIIDLSQEKSKTIYDETVISTLYAWHTYIIGNPDLTLNVTKLIFEDISVTNTTRTVHMKDFHVQSKDAVGVFCNYYTKTNNIGDCNGGIVKFDVAGNCSISTTNYRAPAIMLANQSVTIEGSGNLTIKGGIDENLDGPIVVKLLNFDNSKVKIDYNFNPIKTSNDLSNIRNNPSGTFVLMNDIDLKGVDWSPIPTFNGTLDGNGHSIYNFSITKTGGTGTGIYAFINNNTGTIKKLTIGKKEVTTYDSKYSVKYNINYTESGSESSLTVGVLVGVNTGKINNCHVVNTYVNATFADNDNDEHLYLYVGGIASFNQSEISECTVQNSKIDANATCPKESGDNNFCWVGGISGKNWVTITLCTVQNTTLNLVVEGDGYPTSWFNSNEAEPFGALGGIVGEQLNGKITSCEVSGNSLKLDASSGSYTHPKKHKEDICGLISGGTVSQ